MLASIFPSLEEPILIAAEITYFLFPTNILKIFDNMVMKNKILIEFCPYKYIVW